MQDFWEPTTHTTKDFEGKFSKLRGSSPEILEMARQLFGAIQELSSPCRESQPDPDNWFWSFGDLTGGTFVLPNKATYAVLLPVSTAWKVANGRWVRQEIEEVWTKRWKKLLGSDLTIRSKIFLWQITMHGLYTQERARRLGHGDGCCSLSRRPRNPREYFLLLPESPN